MMINSKTQLVINMVSNLFETLKDINESFDEEKKGFGDNSWIVAEIYFDEESGNIKFTP